MLAGVARAARRGHAALLGGRVVVATDGGLLGLKRRLGPVWSRRCLFLDSQAFVSAGDELLANSDGALFVVGARDIMQLTLLDGKEDRHVVAAP